MHNISNNSETLKSDKSMVVWQTDNLF